MKHRELLGVISSHRRELHGLINTLIKRQPGVINIKIGVKIELSDIKELYVII